MNLKWWIVVWILAAVAGWMFASCGFWAWNQEKTLKQEKMTIELHHPVTGQFDLTLIVPDRAQTWTALARWIEQKPGRKIRIKLEDSETVVERREDLEKFCLSHRSQNRRRQA